MKNSKPKIGLALGSGGARGFTIIGIIKTLEKHGIDIDCVAGSSIGSIIGGAYAIEKNTPEIEKTAISFTNHDFLDSFADPLSKNGLIQGNKFLDKLKSYIGNRNIEDLEIPFAAVATDNKTGLPIVLDHGDLAEAMRASSSVPIFFEPVVGKTGVLLDGGVSEQVPADIVRKMGADIVIAVNLVENTDIDEKKNKKSQIEHYLMLLQKNLARENCKSGDIVISPNFETTSWVNNFKNREALIAEGERVAEEKIEEILAVLKKGGK